MRHVGDSTGWSTCGAPGRFEELAAWLCAAHGTVPPPPVDDAWWCSQAITASPVQADVAFHWADHRGHAADVRDQRRVTVLARQVGARYGCSTSRWTSTSTIPEEVRAFKVLRFRLHRRRGRWHRKRSNALRGRPCRGRRDRRRGAGVIPGDMGIGNSTVAAALVAASLGLPADEVVGTGTGVDEDGRARKVAVLDAALARAGHVEDPLSLLAALGSACAAATAGFVVQAAVRATPVLLDGVFSCAAALVARDLAPDAPRWWLAGHRSTEPAQGHALKALGLEPILDLGLRLGEGSGAVQAVSVLKAARAVLAEMGALADLT